jgi:hypothetical protein
MTDAMPDADVIYLPPVFTKHPPSPHTFGDAKWIKPDPARDRHAQTERTCSACGAVKVTVHAPNNRHWREWRKNAGADQGPLPVACEPIFGAPV